MNKIILILKREYLTRVRKKSFIVMTFLGPLLMAAMFIVPILLATMEDDDIKTISIVDETYMFKGKFKDEGNLKFEYLEQEIDSAKAHLYQSGHYAVLHIPATEVSTPEDAFLYSKSQPNINVVTHIKSVMRNEVERQKLSASGIDQDILKSIKTNISLNTIKLSDTGEEKKGYTELNMAVGFFFALMVYFFIFMWGAQAMRGVIEEKSNRIVEVIISSVKPFQLMMGKIVGIALVGLTQFVLWVVLTGGIYIVFGSIYANEIQSKNASEMMMQQQQMMPQGTETQFSISDNQETFSEIFNMIDSIDFPLLLSAFLFFFIFGYLMYAALFAAIGSAVDNEADTQQFMLPVTAPLIIAFVSAQMIIQNPEGPLAFWLSIIPFTSPVVMMVRIPFGVDVFDMVLSMVLLVLGFIGTTWFAGKIYRTGILMYGKKVSYKELWKWLKY
ncbi:MAG: ABC transporter permease [Bacteroidales bacterium]|nr:ABC transporter permease [Bacteroidales bacterium]